MIVLTQGLGTSQIVTWGFGDNFTHADGVSVITGYWEPRRWGTFYWGSGYRTNIAEEDKPVAAMSTEDVPGVGVGARGAWTVPGQRGAWTPSPLGPRGAYTQLDAFRTEYRPNYTGSTEAKPTT